MDFIGIWGAHAQTFLLLVVAATTLVFALPIFLVPFRWAGWFGWKIPQETDLALYFGRCLGGFILMLEVLMLRAALTGAGIETVFLGMAVVAALLVWIHILGAVQKVQPPLETLEIGMYGGLFVLTLLFWPAAV